MAGNWCILRTSGRTTLRLAEALNAAGLKSWTPVETKTIRVPRQNLRRQVTIPLMPSFVFSGAEHLIELLDMATSEERQTVDFSVMHYAGRIPLIADSHLDALRRIERRRRAKRKADRSFPVGVEVKVKTEGGSFAGMSGRVEQSNNGHSLVCFGDRMTVKIDTLLLADDDVGAEEPYERVAVLRAA